MVSKATVDQCLYMIKIDRTISITDDEFILKSKLLQQVFRDRTDDEFQAATYKLLEDPKELYGKLPTIAMYKEKLNGLDLPIEDLANREALLIIKAISSYWSVLESTNETTLKTVEDLGGLKSLKWRLDSDNPYKDDIKWLKKEIKDLWISNANAENKQNSILDSCEYLKNLSGKLSKRLSYAI